MASICRFDLVAKRQAGYAVSMEVARTGRAKTALLETLVWPATQPKIIGLDSIPTAVRYRIEDNEELESST